MNHMDSALGLLDCNGMYHTYSNWSFVHAHHNVTLLILVAGHDRRICIYTRAVFR
jgi:hypothetical protein